jgi:hypothetical protein
LIHLFADPRDLVRFRKRILYPEWILFISIERILYPENGFCIPTKKEKKKKKKKKKKSGGDKVIPIHR